LKKSGLSIKEIKAYMDMVQRGDESLSERLVLFRARKEAVKKQFAELQETLDLLDYKCWYYEEAIRLGSDKPLQNLTPADVPEKFRNTKEKMNLLHEFQE
jgi:DNA-binding transcriptional MerR regulator